MRLETPVSHTLYVAILVEDCASCCKPAHGQRVWVWAEGCAACWKPAHGHAMNAGHCNWLTRQPFDRNPPQFPPACPSSQQLTSTAHVSSAATFLIPYTHRPRTPCLPACMHACLRTHTCAGGGGGDGGAGGAGRGAGVRCVPFGGDGALAPCAHSGRPPAHAAAPEPARALSRQRRAVGRAAAWQPAPPPARASGRAAQREPQRAVRGAGRAAAQAQGHAAAGAGVGVRGPMR
eukprot:79000-Chlamydomonas_euryale.AAC.1